MHMPINGIFAKRSPRAIDLTSLVLRYLTVNTRRGLLDRNSPIRPDLSAGSKAVGTVIRSPRCLGAEVPREAARSRCRHRPGGQRCGTQLNHRSQTALACRTGVSGTASLIVGKVIWTFDTVSAPAVHKVS